MALPASLEGKLRLPMIGAPLFIVSGPELVIAQCKAGIIGSFPALNARPQELLKDWLKEIKETLGTFAEENPDTPVAPFAVNQICHASNNRLAKDVETCIRHEVPVIITSLRPPADIVKGVQAYGGMIFHDVINIRHARKAMEAGVDGIIAVCAGAGGHAGTTSPFALVKEIKREYDGAVILSGCMTSGADILAARAIGADLAYIGTRFIATDEANAKPAYKQMIVDSSAADIVYTSHFSGVHGSYLRGSIENNGMDPNALAGADKSTMDFAKRNKDGNNEAKAWKDIWSAGQGVGSIDEVLPAGEVVERMAAEYEAARATL
ncbi:MAG: nitronate monooxygenase family protein [Pseudomonadota bacterium]